jgi:hypothetical protein
VPTTADNHRISVAQPERVTPLKEGTPVPANCSVKRKRNPNDKRTGWQFKQPHVREKIDVWNEAQKRRARELAREREYQRIKSNSRWAKASHVFTRHPNGWPKNDYQRWVSIEGQEGQRQSGIRRARELAQQRKSPTSGLSGLKEYKNGHFRSLAESYTAAYIVAHDLPDVNIRYAETHSTEPPARSATINRQATFRQDDFHVDVGDKKYKIQVKGAGYFFKRLEKILGPLGTEKQFRRYRSDLLNLINEDVINQLELSLAKDVREQLLSSTTSLWDWIKNEVTIDSKESFLKLYKRESNRFQRYLYTFAESVFPRELEVINRAVALFLEVKEQEPELIAADVVDTYIDCLTYAMDELDYEDHVRTQKSEFHYWRRNRDRLRSILPSKYKPTNP